MKKMENWKNKTLTFLSLIGLSSPGAVHAQNKNVITELYKVSGNCGMCKKTIEAAATKKGNKVDWNEAKKELTVSYDPKKKNADEILKSVAYAGYDNEKYLAPQTAYSKLPACCQYERSEKALAATIQVAQKTNSPISSEIQKEKKVLEPVYALYFLLKDALVKTDAATASAKSKELLAEINSVKMESLSENEHAIFMKHLSGLKVDAGRIAESKDINRQRECFTTLSQNMFELIKVIKPAYTVYLDHCPMFNDGKGANWISKESVIKNPYYGSQMMSCGKISETIKQ